MTPPPEPARAPTPAADLDAQRRRNRMMLVGLFAIFFGTLAVAGILRFSGWRPQGMKNRGELLQPPADVRAITPTLLDALHRVWLSEGRHADKVEVLWFGELPAGAPAFSGLVPMQPSAALQAKLPDLARADALPVYLADPNGYLVLRYAPGFNPSGLRKDLGRVVK